MKLLSTEALRKFFNDIKAIFASKEEVQDGLDQKQDIIKGPDGSKYKLIMDENGDFFLQKIE